MMRVNRWVLLSLASLVLVSYVSQISQIQAAENPVSASSKPTAPRSQPTLMAQMMQVAKPIVVSSGSFTAGEQPTQGSARVVNINGKYFLDLDQGFKTSSQGPDLVVILHRSSNVIGSTKPPAYPLKAGDYVILAPLQKFNGAQRYIIPSNINVANYKSAAIWCRKFNATFGAAKLVNQ
ncbi:MAG: DM13 domain-containing protein [Leptolyngbya sp. BL-A-14]